MKTARIFFALLLVSALLCGFGAVGSADAGKASLTEEELLQMADDAFHIVCDICPAETALASNIKCEPKQDKVCTFSFDTVYGHFKYVIDLSDGKVLEKEEPDLEAARAKTGFQEPMSYNDLLGKVFDASPLTMSQTKNIKSTLRSDGKCMITFGSAYGDFVYLLDPYTGEILEREEPDMISAQADKDFKERLDADDLLTCVFKECPIDITAARKITAALRADDRWTVTFGSSYGDFLYVLDPYGVILDKTEPDLEAAKTQAGFQEPLSADEVLDAVFKACPIDITAAQKLKTSPKGDDTWTVSFGSSYGDFLYVVDGFTGEILEKTEPDLEAAKAQAASAGPLSTDDVMNRVFGVCPLTPDKLSNIKLSQRSDGVWTVTFDSADGPFLYLVDGNTGEILEKTEP